MIISHEHRFIFVRTRKTAGTSLEIVLSALVGPDAVITSVSPRDERGRQEWGGRPPQNHLTAGHDDPGTPVPPGPGPGVRFYNHMPAARIRDLVGERIWSRYLTFCFERNPWDKVVSLYYHRYRSEPRPGLLRFLRSGEAADCVNWPLYTDGGRQLVDAVGRYERLSEDFTALLARVGLVAPGRLPTAKSHFRPPGRNYRTELGPRERELVADIFAAEIGQHGYRW
jgi:hypothetical protein